ncbi:hypothetical protein M404DRAFT_1003864 [Pisolithus tinctorius Marx 270]|uniref:Uncharacterized protein n=1 Tax=Pisolithus tinctorius Marx 270 TaxID=870435 RepID=A0A0C3NZA2_PISTI|nr:hypothetical protein M404DRAFT_1003864 [Pisolithus tinctorius Marx 270]
MSQLGSSVRCGGNYSNVSRRHVQIELISYSHSSSCGNLVCVRMSDLCELVQGTKYYRKQKSWKLVG